MTYKEKTENTDIIISGGGAPGLLLASLLGRIGLRISIIEPYPPGPLNSALPDGRTVALMAGSINILKATPSWDRCARYGSALETLEIIEGPTRGEFFAGDIGLPSFGTNIPNNILRSAVFEDVKKMPNITLYSSPLKFIDQDDFTITSILDDGTRLRSRLLVGADGRQSKTRDLANIGIWERDYQQTAITCLIEHSRPHHNTSIEFHRPGGPFTLVPMPGMHSSVVWVEYHADAQNVMRLRRDSFEKALQERTEGRLGNISLKTAPESWPLKALRSSDLTAPRIVLVAEAAHVVHPLGAQGLNLSLRDIAVLAEEVADAARHGLDIGSQTVLRNYTFRRRADILTRSTGTDSLNRMISNNAGILRDLRRAGLSTISGVGRLRRLAMNEGIIPGYDDSRLARGEML